MSIPIRNQCAQATEGEGNRSENVSLYASQSGREHPRGKFTICFESLGQFAADSTESSHEDGL